MLNCYYVPIKIIDSPYSLLHNVHVDTAVLEEKDLNFETLLNIIVKEIQLNQQHDGN